MKTRDLELRLNGTRFGTLCRDERDYLFFAYTADYLTVACREPRTLT
jgi:hypothetical protein